MYNAATGRTGNLIGGGGFNQLSAGAKRYGAGRRAPNIGMTSNMTGYGERDLRNQARQNALFKRIGRI